MKIRYDLAILIFLILVLIVSFMFIIDHTIKKIEGFDDDILLGIFGIIGVIVGIFWISKRIKNQKK